MCTLTFVPTVDGYLAGMNRDELLTRPAALPPEIHERERMKLVYPREPSGGTWIACNSHGNLLAVLNWNEFQPGSLREKRRTRGLVILCLILEENSFSTDFGLKRLTLDGAFPFRLIGVFQNERKLIEWCWDGGGIQQLTWPWSRKHWFSSSLSDTSATENRGRVCEASSLDPAVGSRSWLQTLHRSHEPDPGPYSVCVHRLDASTVSYTEVECDRSSISMRYLSGSPCLKVTFDELATVQLSDSLAA
jgi:transport and Golgi organization protein 2